jgi:hypothetical protein
MVAASGTPLRETKIIGTDPLFGRFRPLRGTAPNRGRRERQDWFFISRNRESVCRVNNYYKDDSVRVQSECRRFKS